MIVGGAVHPATILGDSRSFVLGSNRVEVLEFDVKAFGAFRSHRPTESHQVSIHQLGAT